MELDDDLVDVVLVLSVLLIGVAGLVILLAKYVKKIRRLLPCCHDKEDQSFRPHRNTIRVAKKCCDNGPQSPRAAAPVRTTPPPFTPTSPSAQQQFVYIVQKPPTYKQEMVTHQNLSAQSSSTCSSYLPSQIAPPATRRLSY